MRYSMLRGWRWPINIIIWGGFLAGSVCALAIARHATLKMVEPKGRSPIGGIYTFAESPSVDGSFAAIEFDPGLLAPWSEPFKSGAGLGVYDQLICPDCNELLAQVKVYNHTRGIGAIALDRPATYDQWQTVSAILAPSIANAAPAKEGWYFPIVPPPGDGATFDVGPYGTLAVCRDMYGSAIYSHPFACHITGPKPPSNCRNIGNGFAYPKDYPYPVPSNEPIVGVIDGGDCVKQVEIKDEPERGWYFLFYGPTGSTAAKCKNHKAYAKLSVYNPAYQLGNYSDIRCPGAPCFSVGFDTACD